MGTSDKFIHSGIVNAPAKKGAKTALLDLSLQLRLQISNGKTRTPRTSHAKSCIRQASPEPSRRKSCRSTSRCEAVCHTSHVRRHTSHSTRHMQQHNNLRADESERNFGSSCKSRVNSKAQGEHARDGKLPLLNSPGGTISNSSLNNASSSLPTSAAYLYR